MKDRMKPVRRLSVLLLGVVMYFGSCKNCMLEASKPLAMTSAITAHGGQAKKDVVIVLIHGTLLPFPSLTSFGTVVKKCFSKKAWHKSWYNMYIKALRRNTIFKYQPSGPRGLHVVGPKSSLAAQLSGRFFSDLYRQEDPSINVHCYTFSWNGRLSQRHRLNAAYKLYHKLMKVLSLLERDSTEVILVGHSHGGNVILNLARAEKKYRNGLMVDRAVLLGTPVQCETRHLLKHSMFKIAYHCYSTGDRIQNLDFISTKDHASQRRFPQEYVFDKLTQIELNFGSYMPNHSELWLCWGQDNFVYRKYLPIYPLPFFFFLPELIKQLELLPSKASDLQVTVDRCDQDYVIDCCVCNEHMVLPYVKVALTYQQLSPYIQTVLKQEGVA